MNFLQNLLAVLRNFFVAQPGSAAFYQSRPLGPKFTWLASNKIRIDEGELAGEELGLTTDISDDEAHVHLLREGKEIGHCDIQRDAHEATVVLWNIVVQEQLRHKGLASIMTFVGFRKMLELYKSASFGIRMVRLIKPSEMITKIQNVGIGVIARKLGFEPEYNLPTLMRQQNIQMIELISADGVMPPGYRLVLKVFPLVLIAFLVDPENGKPYPAGHRIYNSLVTPESAEQWAKDERIIIGNGNYVLTRPGISEMVNHLALNDLEAGIYARRIRSV
jgi:hypothetical protein